MPQIPIFELKNVFKSFIGVEALNDINIQAYPGQVLCLLGDNGAGKSTLIKILSGVHKPTEGKLIFDNHEIEFEGPHEAIKRGVATVHQVGGTVPMMSIGRNFLLGVEKTKGWGPFKTIDMEFSNRVAVEELKQLGITRVDDGNALVGGLSGGERQCLTIARAMYLGAKVLILDEPTAALGVKEAAKVLHLIVKAQAKGLAVIFVTHNAHHAMTVGDHFVVLIRGKVVADFKKGERTKDDLLDLMAGGEAMSELETELELARAEQIARLGKEI